MSCAPPGRDANLLLNIGPRPDGTVQPEAVERLQELGKWLGVNGSSIYGTRGGPTPPREWGVTTQRADTIFVHVLDWRDPQLSIPLPGRRVTSATLFGGERQVAFVQTGSGVTLTLPELNVPDRIITLVTHR